MPTIQEQLEILEKDILVLTQSIEKTREKLRPMYEARGKARKEISSITNRRSKQNTARRNESIVKLRAAGLTYKNIAEIIGCTLTVARNAVSSTFHRQKNFVRKVEFLKSLERANGGAPD